MDSMKRHYTMAVRILALIMMLSVYGCKTKKAINLGPVPDRSDTEVMQALQDHNHDFDWYACKTGISLDMPDQSVSGTAYIRMKKDSIIWSVVKKLKVEAVRMLATENTYAAINRIEGTYQKGSTEDELRKIGLSMDFTDIQQAIFGNIIIPDESQSTIAQEGEHYIITAIDGDLQLKYWISGYDLLLDQVQLTDYRGREVSITYDDYREIESGEIVPFFRQYNMPYQNQGQSEIIMKVKDIEINVPKKTSFSIPQRYERIY